MAVRQGTPGPDTVDGTNGNDYIYGYAGDDILNGLAGRDVLYGGDGNDQLYGGDGDDQLTGGAGADYMAGGLGNDTYFVENIGDRVVEAANEGNDTVVSYLRDYRLGANLENLVLQLSSDQDGKGNELDNRIKGNDFANSIQAFAGNDVVFGYGGNDVINPGTGHDSVNGGDGIDILTYKVGATHGVDADLSATDFLNPHVVYTYGDGSTDTLAVRNVENLEGTAFNDVLSGDGGANKIQGLDGNDVLRGRAGNDDLTGGTGADTFVFEAAGTANGVDIVRTFQSGSDVLQFYSSDGYDPTAGFTLITTGSGHAASGNGAQFIFNANTHQLFYDADGAGGADAILLAAVLGDQVRANDIHVDTPAL